MSGQSEIDLKQRNEFLENENSLLRSMLNQQATLGHRMTEIVAEMEKLLEKKKSEIESLTDQLHAPQPSLANDSNFQLAETEGPPNIVKVKELERTKNGKFECPFKDICSHKAKHRANLEDHIRTHTGEKPFVCDICKRAFKRKDHCKQHMLTHPETNGATCRFCFRRYSASNIKGHYKTCPRRKRKFFDSE